MSVKSVSRQSTAVEAGLVSCSWELHMAARAPLDDNLAFTCTNRDITNLREDNWNAELTSGLGLPTVHAYGLTESSSTGHGSLGSQHFTPAFHELNTKTRTLVWSGLPQEESLKPW